MTKGSKIAWVIGGLTVIGAGIGIYFYLRNRPDKDVEMTDKDLANLDKSPITDTYIPPVIEVTTIDVDKTPPVESKSSKEISYNHLLSRFKDSNYTKRYADYFTYTVTPTALGLQGLPRDTKAQVKFQKGGGWRLYLLMRGSEKKFLTGGMYYKAGTKLVVYNGINKGLIVESKNPLANVVRVATA